MFNDGLPKGDPDCDAGKSCHQVLWRYSIQVGGSTRCRYSTQEVAIQMEIQELMPDVEALDNKNSWAGILRYSDTQINGSEQLNVPTLLISTEPLGFYLKWLMHWKFCACVISLFFDDPPDIDTLISANNCREPKGHCREPIIVDSQNSLKVISDSQ